MTNPSRE